ncbi:hypothetical protein EDD17DRAFT_1520395 [Pisolithus thermaeus]|nr:hypothetical protein EDD17DRAFT_1520395 [Pisolithus thermaeus]
MSRWRCQLHSRRPRHLAHSDPELFYPLARNLCSETSECHEQPAKGSKCGCMCERRVTTSCQNAYAEQPRTSSRIHHNAKTTVYKSGVYHQIKVASNFYIIRYGNQRCCKSGTSSLNLTSTLIQGRQKTEASCNFWPVTYIYDKYSDTFLRTQ